jgi:hypothetical protein
LGDGDDVVGIPEGFAAFESPSGDGLETGGAPKTADVRVFGDAVRAANGADPFIALQHAFAQVTRVAAKLPFFYTEGGTECLPANGHFKLTPAAEITAVGAFGKGGFIGPASRHGAFGAHRDKDKTVWAHFGFGRCAVLLVGGDY